MNEQDKSFFVIFCGGLGAACFIAFVWLFAQNLRLDEMKAELEEQKQTLNILDRVVETKQDKDDLADRTEERWKDRVDDRLMKLETKEIWSK